MFTDPRDQEANQQDFEILKQGAKTFVNNPLFNNPMGHFAISALPPRSRENLVQYGWRTGIEAQKYAMQQSFFIAGHLPGFMFSRIGGTAGGSFRWFGALGMRTGLGGTTGFGAGIGKAISSLPGGNFVNNIAEGASKFLLGTEISMASIAKAGTSMSTEMANSVLTAATERITTAGIKNVNLWDLKKAFSAIDTGATSPLNQAGKTATLNVKAPATNIALSRYKWMLAGKAATAFIQPIITAADVARTIGSIGAGAIRMGYSTSEFMARQTRRLSERVRTTEFETDLSAWATTAAKTERTALMEQMFSSRINGAMPYGSETDRL